MRKFIYSLLLFSVFWIGSAHAAVDPEALTAMGNEISGDAASVFAWVLPIIGTIIAMVVGIRLIKRFTRAI